MTTLVTGGTGFVGRYVVEELIGRREPIISYNRDFAVSEHDLVTTVQGELFDIPKLVRTLAEHRVVRVIHTAAMSHPEISIDLPITTFASNVDGTLKLFEAARLASVRRIVNFSSECAYGDQDEASPVLEDARPMPNTPYGVTKVATELLGRVYNRLYGLDVLSLRVTEVYGPGLKMPEILKDLVGAASRGTSYRLEEGADHRFHFVHAADVAQAAVRAAWATNPGQGVYNVSGGRQVTIGELLMLIRDRYPQADLSVGPGHLTDWDRQGPFDISAAERDLGYRPNWTLEAGIDAYGAWLSEHTS